MRGKKVSELKVKERKERKAEKTAQMRKDIGKTKRKQLKSSEKNLVMKKK